MAQKFKHIFLIASLLIVIIPSGIFSSGFELTDDPLSGFSDNTIIDFEVHDGAIWAVTGNGLSFTSDGGAHWSYFDTTNGLFSHDIASIYSHKGRLWLGLVPPERADYGVYLSFTDDNGLNWDTLQMDTAYDYDNPIFDIDGADSIIFFTSQVSGLFGSFDDGATWKRVYYSPYDSAYVNYQYQYTNHYFSAAIDTSHTDSIVIWGGTANGLMRFVFSPVDARLMSNHITNFSSGDGFVFIGGDSGMTRLSFPNSLESFVNSTVVDGLPGLAISASYFFGGRLFAGTLDTLGGDGTGLAISDDSGFNFHTNYTGLDGLIGENKYPTDFVSVGDVLFMAGFESGLFKTLDTGKTWSSIVLDADPTSGRNVVSSVDIDSAFLWVGTDSGLVRLLLDLDNDAAIVDDSNIVFTDSPSTGGRGYKVRVQQFYGDDDVLDSTTVWNIQYPLDEAEGMYSLVYSSDDGANWDIDATSIGRKKNDIAFADSIVYFVGDNNLTVTDDRILFLSIPGSDIVDSTERIVATMDALDITSIEIVEDTIYLGSEFGLAVAPAGTNSWKFFFADDNPQHFSRVDRILYDNGMTGDWASALAINPYSQKIYVSSRPGPAFIGANGITAISLDGQTVDSIYGDSRVWNFAFDNQNIFAASDAGLLFSSNDGATWDTLSISGNLATSGNNEPFDLDSVAVYGVLVDDGVLWVGTERGAASIDLDNIGLDEWDIYRVFDEGGDVYAYPVPFSPYDGTQKVTFHYPVPQAANATIEVYDFAMNLVKTVISNEPKPPGIASTDQWTGYDGWGKIVAVGIYYFKVSLSTGEEYWGKLALMP